MPKIFSKLNLDFSGTVKSLLTAVQGDQNSRYIDMQLQNKGIAIDLTDCVVKIYANKPPAKEPCPKTTTNSFIYNIGQITDAINGRVQFALTTEFLENPGIIECEVTIEKIIKNKSELLTSPKFNILVSETLKNDKAIESTNEYGALILMYENVVEASKYLTNVVEVIGVPGEISQENSINTIFEALEKIITFVKNSSGGSGDFSQINTKIDEQTIILNAKIENSTDEIIRKIEELPRRRNYRIISGQRY